MIHTTRGTVFSRDFSRPAYRVYFESPERSSQYYGVHGLVSTVATPHHLSTRDQILYNVGRQNVYPMCLPRGISHTPTSILLEQNPHKNTILDNSTEMKLIIRDSDRVTMKACTKTN